MFEDAPVNTGAVQWPDTDSAFWTVRRTQLKLHRWASEDHTRRFGDLFNLVYDPAFLMHAWERVSSNAGARTRGQWIGSRWPRSSSRGGVEVFLGQIRDLLKSGKYEPVQVRRVTIPKASGKLRQAGDPDRGRPGGPGQPQGGTGTHLRGRLRAVLVRVPAEPPRAGRDRRDPLLGQPLPRVGAGGRHPGVFRRDRTHAATGTGAEADQGQAGPRAGESVPEVGGHDDVRGRSRTR